MPARLNPYLTFPGNAREAMEYYHDVLGGNLVLTTFAEGGMADNPADADKVMHGQLETDNGFTLMGSDARSDAPGEPMSGVQISLSGDTAADAELSGYYDRLAQRTVADRARSLSWLAPRDRKSIGATLRSGGLG